MESNVTYLYSNPQPISGNVGVLNQNRIVSNTNPLPVTLGSNTIAINGNVNIPGNIQVYSSPEDPVHVHLTEVGTYGNLTTFVPISGVVYLGSNTLASLANVNANITNSSIAVTQSGAWTVGISNANVAVSQYGPWNVGILGVPTVDIRSFPGNATVNVTGNVGLLNGYANVNISNIPTVTLSSNSVTVSGNIAGINSLPPVTLASNNVTVSGNIGVLTNGALVSNTNPFATNIVGNVNIGTMPQTNVYILNSNVAAANVVYGDSSQVSASGRLRVEVAGQQWWYVPSVDKDGDLRITEKFVGSNATSTFVQNLASVKMTSGLTYDSNVSLTGSAIRMSRRRHKTRPNITHEWTGVINWDGKQTSVTKRVGMFTNFNGVFFEVDGTDLYAVVRRRLTDGTLVENRIQRTSFNGDKLDGTGPSGENWTTSISGNVTSITSQANVAITGDGTVYNVTWQLPAGEETRFTVGTKVTTTGITPSTLNGVSMIASVDTLNHRITTTYVNWPGNYVSAAGATMTNTPFHSTNTYWFDFIGSRTNRIRFGKYTNAGKIVLHNYIDNLLGTQFVDAPALPDRKEVINTGIPTYMPSMTVAGSGVGIETTSEIVPGFGVALSTVPVAYNKSLTEEYAVLGIGLRYGEPYQRADLQVTTINLVDISNVNVQQYPVLQWRLVLNPTLTGTIPSSINIGKASQMWDYATGVTASGGIDLTGGFLIGSSTLDVTTALNFLNVGSNIDYTDSDKVVLVVKLLSGGSSNSSIISAINFFEDL